jgi:nitronate monooxygenase
MAKAWNQTRVSEALAIQYPIIQGPLGGFSSQNLTAAVSNFGGLGSFGAHGLEPHAMSAISHAHLKRSSGTAIRPISTIWRKNRL